MLDIISLSFVNLNQKFWVCSGTISKAKFLNPKVAKTGLLIATILLDTPVLLHTPFTLTPTSKYYRTHNRAFFIYLKCESSVQNQGNSRAYFQFTSPAMFSLMSTPAVPAPAYTQQLLNLELQLCCVSWALPIQQPGGPLDVEIQQVPQSQHVKTESPHPPWWASAPLLLLKTTSWKGPTYSTLKPE